MRKNEVQFNPRSVQWVEAAPGAVASAKGNPEEAKTGFHFIRAGRVGDGESAFGSAERSAMLEAMVDRTFPSGSRPDHVVKLMKMTRSA